MSLQNAFTSLPEKIREWVASDEVTDILFEKSKELGLSGNHLKILPELVLRVVAQDLDPRDFTNELGKGLGVNYQTAQSIAGQLHSEIFEPIEVDLKKIGVDTHNIISHQVKPSPELEKLDGKPSPKTEASPKKVITPENLPIKKELEVPLGDKPFILHKEEEVSPVGLSDKQPSFRYQAPNREPSESPIRAEVEGLRVVHYSSFFTPLNQPQFKKRPEIKIPGSKWFGGVERKLL